LRSAVVGIAVAAMVGRAGLGRATPADDNKQACADAYVNAQTLRRAGALTRARVEASRCSASTCPAVLTPRCIALARDLDGEQPTVVFGAADGAGRRDGTRDGTAVRVFVDGALVLDRLDGRAVPVDPGSRRIRFEREGSPPVEQQVLVRSGEKDRPVVARFAGPSSAERQPAGPPGPTDVPSPGGRGRAPALVALATGAVGLGLGIVAGVLAIGTKGSLDSGCATRTSCPPDKASEIRTLNTETTLANVGFAVAIVGLTVGGVLLATRSKSSPPASAALRVEMTARGPALAF